MSLLDWAIKTIPPPDNKKVRMHNDGNTRDIIDTILYADSRIKNHMCEFSSAFEANYQGLYDLWEFTKNHITYLADEPGHEKVKDPAVTWRDRSGDCKSFSLFIASVLKCLRITHRYRFASYSGNDPTHVYVIAKLNNRNVILDATIDKFDSEVSYKKKWDKMAKIDYLHGVSAAVHTGRAKPSASERIANAPKSVLPKTFIDYTAMTEGQLTLGLLDQLTRLQSAYYGDPDGMYQKALNIIYQTAKDPHRISGHVGYIDPQLYGLMNYIEYARERSKPAGIASAHIGDFASDRKAIMDACKHARAEQAKTRTKNCGFPASHTCLEENKRAEAYIPKKLDGSVWNKNDLSVFIKNCSEQIFFMDAYNQYLENTSPHLLYEFADRSILTGTANFKANNHRLSNSTMARYSKLDRANIVLWERLGISRISASKGLADISPEGLIRQWRTVGKDQIGDPVTVGAIIFAAIGFASKLIDLLITKQASIISDMRGFGSKEFGPEAGDFEGTGSGFDFNSLLVPGALALGGILLLNKK
jgi:hypothetical protein